MFRFYIAHLGVVVMFKRVSKTYWTLAIFIKLTNNSSLLHFVRKDGIFRPVLKNSQSPEL